MVFWLNLKHNFAAQQSLASSSKQTANENQESVISKDTADEEEVTLNKSFSIDLQCSWIIFTKKFP